jgi:hypothetical protein
MEITLTTPSLLFPAISLLLLAYTNRFLAVASLIRHLTAQFREEQTSITYMQIESLRRRVNLIKNMQAVGVFSLFLCVLCMLVLFAGWIGVGKCIFGLSLIALLCSLGISIWEIQLSVRALNLELSGLDSTVATHNPYPASLTAPESPPFVHRGPPPAPTRHAILAPEAAPDATQSQNQDPEQS